MNPMMINASGMAGNAAQSSEAWWAYLLWVAAAALLGFVVSAVCAGRFQLPRRLFLIPYILLVAVFLTVFFRWSGLSLVELFRDGWVWGVIGALLVGAFLVRNIRSQPGSSRAEGLPLAFDLLWSGVLYGAADAMLLSILPVLAVWQAFAGLDLTTALPGKIAAGAAALAASLLVTICYHLGFPEYRARGGVLGPTIGNGIMTLAYLLTTNPISAVLSHMAMHIAGVVHGPASVMQLPPHYGE